MLPSDLPATNGSAALDADLAHLEAKTIERGLIGGCILTPRSIGAASRLVDADMFRYDLHRDAWVELVQAHDDGAPLDAVALYARLRARWGGQAMELLSGSFAEDSAFGSPDTLARIVRHNAARRARIKLADKLADSDTDAIRDRLDEIAALEADPAASHPVLARSRTGNELLTAELPSVPSLAGDGLLVRGGLFVLAGHSGLGKTFLALQLMRSLAAGADFLGFPCFRCRVGLLELEMPEASIRDRLRGLGDGLWLDNTRFLAVPDLIVNVLHRADRQWISDWCRAERLDVLLIDPLNALHNLDDNSTQEAGKVMRAVREIRSKTGACVGLVHHVRKSQATQTAPPGVRTPVLESVRGSGRLGNDPDTVLGMLEGPTGFTRFVFAKTRYVATPDELYLRRDEPGYFHVTEAPSEKAEKNRERILKCLMLSPQSAAAIADTLDLDRSTVQRHLRSMAPEVAPIDGTWPVEYRYEGPRQ